MRRRDVLLGLVVAGSGITSSSYGQSSKPARIGLVASLPLRPIERFRAKLKELGYEEGANLVIEARFAEGHDERYPAFVADLIAKDVDILVVWGTPAALAAKRATTTVPIVLGAVGDVLNTGIVKSLAKPEGNITGFSAVNVELEEKRVELLKQLLPNLSRLGVLANVENPLSVVNLEMAKRAAKLWNLNIDVADVGARADIDSALEKLAAAKPDAALLASDTLLLSARKKIVEFMADHKIPAIYPFREYAEAGGLVVHGADLSALFERAASYVDRILKGARPGDLPVQQATTFEVIINMKAADALGLTIPPSLLARADEVIE